MSIFCLTRVGVSLTPDMADDLYRTARRMFRAKDPNAVFKSPHWEGHVRTSWKRVEFAGTVAMHFNAFVGVGRGIASGAEVSFIVLAEDLTSTRDKIDRSQWSEAWM